MFRKFLGALTSTAVVAGLATAGVVATATPAAATVDTGVTNPDVSGCGIPITLVLDASTSIAGQEEDDVRDAAKAFLSGLKDTGSSARIIQFSRSSKEMIGRTPIESGTNLGLLNDSIDNDYPNRALYPNGVGPNGTNWESPLWRTYEEQPDPGKGLVVFVTDGEPNATGAKPLNPVLGQDAQVATDAAKVYSDLLKTAGNRMLAVGVGMSNSASARDRLRQISGPDLVSSVGANQTINDFDVLVTDDFAELTESLKRVATSLCGGSITLKKMTDDAEADTWAAVAGWTFRAEIQGATVGTDFDWVKPSPNNTQYAEGETEAPGPQVQFQYFPRGASWNTKNPSIKITETLDKLGYTPRTPLGYECSFNASINPRDPISGPVDTVTVPGKASFVVANVKSDQSVSCQIYNTRDRGKLKIIKSVSNPDQATLDPDYAYPIQYKCGPDGTWTDAPVKAGEHTVIEGIPTGTSCDVREGTIAGSQTPDDYTWATSFTPDPATVTITPKDATVEVTVKNTITRDKGKLKIIKSVSNPDQATLDPDYAYPIQYKCGPDGTWTDAPVKAGEHTVIEGIPTGTSCDVREGTIAGSQTPDDYTWATSFTPDPATVTITPKDATVEVTVKNTITRDKGKLKITKIFDKPAGLDLPADFKFQINYTCQEEFVGDVKLAGSAAGDSTVIDNVPTGDCTFTEVALDNPTGWTWDSPSYDPIGQVVKVTTSTTPVEAKVTNTITRNTGMLLLVKEVPEPTGSLTPDKWTLKAGNADSPSKDYSEAGDNTEPQEVWAETPYTLSESPNAEENDYTAGEWDCQIQDSDKQVSPQVNNDIQDGNVVKVPSKTTVVCTIVNTRNTAELKLVKKVEGKDPNAWTLTAKAAATEKQDLNVSNLGNEGDFEPVYAGTEYELKEDGPGGYTPSDWQCVLTPKDEQVEPGQLEEIDLQDGKITLKKGQRVTCTIINTRDLGSLTITKEFNPQQSGYTGTFDINYTCVDGADKVKEGTVKLAAGASETITGLPTGTTCTVTEPNLPANPTGWTFNPPTYSPSNTATVTTKDQTVSVTVINSVAQVSPVVVKKICPIDVTLHKPQPTKVGNKILTDKIKTKTSSCVLLKPVVLCRPIASSAAGETAFCDTKVTKKGRITVKTKGYEAVRVTVIVRTKPKPGFSDRWKPDTWRKSWTLR